MITTEKILAAATRSTAFAYSVRTALLSDLVFPNPFHQEFGRFICDFIDKYGQSPQHNDVAVWISTLPQQRRAGVREVWQRITQESLSGYTEEYLAEEAMANMRAMAARTVKSRLNAMTDVTPEDIQTYADEVSAIRPLTLEGLIDLKDVSRHLVPPVDDEERWSTGIKSLDRWITGFGRELIFVMADTGIGKTTTLVNFGHAGARFGEVVLYITFELSAEAAAHRFYRLIARSDRTEFRKDIKAVEGKVLHWMKYAKGGVYVLYLPAFEHDVHHLQSIIRTFRDTIAVPSTIVLDYLDLLAPHAEVRNVAQWQQLTKMSHMVRNWCDEFGVTVLSATQATRESGTAKRLRMQHMGEAYGKARAADLVIGVSQTDEEKEQHQARMTLVKVRESGGMGVEVPVYINRDLMMVADLKDETTLKIMGRLGHDPTVVKRDSDSSDDGT